MMERSGSVAWHQLHLLAEHAAGRGEVQIEVLPLLRQCQMQGSTILRDTARPGTEHRCSIEVADDDLRAALAPYAGSVRLLLWRLDSRNRQAVAQAASHTSEAQRERAKAKSKKQDGKDKRRARWFGGRK